MPLPSPASFSSSPHEDGVDLNALQQPWSILSLSTASKSSLFTLGPQTAWVTGSNSNYTHERPSIAFPLPYPQLSVSPVASKDETICTNCGTNFTYVWFQGPDGKQLCNPCGQHFHTHDSQRSPEEKVVVDRVVNPRKRTYSITTVTSWGSDVSDGENMASSRISSPGENWPQPQPTQRRRRPRHRIHSPPPLHVRHARTEGERQHIHSQQGPPQRRRKPSDLYTTYANILEDIIGGHPRKKMTLQDIHDYLRCRYPDHFPDDGLGDSKGNGSGGGWKAHEI